MSGAGLRKKLYYSIGEVADSLLVNASLIRYWEKEFPQISPRKNKRGVRVFTESDIDILKEIKYLVKDQGYTLDGAKKILRSKREQNVSNHEVIEMLTRIRTFLVEIN
nr:MerR family transcriptional regulator [Bacteroidota bacterium]